ncbi:hypothetical protein GCM10022389_06530 [Flavobacterium cheonanense]|jgi:phosphotransferase system  glucose/maltose/N-acetylglucosamine-specific IIC component|uniref:Uncharacterized protein n=1 Tax=Flavobacterium cheonanense TaxID=706183 RepID=A0ABP7VCN7_9FLAO|nr:hypothetical protein [Flavobacterium sp.]
MNYLKITKYIYLLIGFIMVYDAISKWNDAEKPWLSVVLAGLAFFTFFFRTRFAKKFEDRKNQNNQGNQNNT